jgi:hypothetical protein
VLVLVMVLVLALVLELALVLVLVLAGGWQQLPPLPLLLPRGVAARVSVPGCSSPTASKVYHW